MGLCDFTKDSRAATSGFQRLAVPYRQALDQQKVLVTRRQRGEIADTLWLLEHPPTITLGTATAGRAGGTHHVLLSESELAGKGYALHRARRGGDVTCHEPGQLVGYPIVDISEGEGDRDLHNYLRQIEAALILLLAQLGLAGVRVSGRTGVWIDGSPQRKIAAIGVRCARWVTSHGFALNVENNLEGFGFIVPCGITGADVTSLERELGADAVPSWAALCHTLHGLLEQSLGRKLKLVYGEPRRLGAGGGGGERAK